MDVTHLCGAKNSGRTIHPGATKASVHESLAASAPFAIVTKAGTLEKYWFHSEGKLFYIAPNPEGGLIGVTTRSIEYVLQIDYDVDDLVRDCSISETWQG